MLQNLRHIRKLPTGLSYLLRSQKAWGQPVFFTIETINSCNFRCIYCPQSDPKNHFVNGRGMMSLTDFKYIIANLRSAFNLQIVSLHRDGEPLLNKNLEAYISHLTEAGTCVTISSNCSLISTTRARSLLAAGLSMVGTDFCADASLYNRLRAGGVWTQTFDGIRNLLDAAKDAKANFRVWIKDLGTDGQSQEVGARRMAETRSLFAKYGDRVTIMPVFFHNALGESLVSIKAAQPAMSLTLAAAAGAGGGGRVMVAEVDGPEPEAAVSHAGNGHSTLTPDELVLAAASGTYTLCHQPWVNLTVDFAGRVVGCCRDLRSEYVVGDLFTQTAAEIWNGERMRSMRKSLASRHPEEISICRQCDVPYHGSYSGRTPLAKIRNFFFSRGWKR